MNLCKRMCIDEKSFNSVSGDGCSRAGLSLDSLQQENVRDLKMFQLVTVKIHRHQELMSCLSPTCFGSKLTSRT